MYDASLARFMTLDPKAEYYPEQSPFIYAVNNPIKHIDYNGEHPVVVIGGIVIGVADLALISLGVISTGFILSQGSDGSIGFSNEIGNLMQENPVFGPRDNWVTSRGESITYNGIPSNDPNSWRPDSKFLKSIALITLASRYIRNHMKGMDPEMDKFVSQLEGIKAGNIYDLEETQTELLMDILNHPDRYTLKQKMGFFNQAQLINAEVERIKNEKDKKKKSDATKKFLNNSSNLEEGNYEWNGSEWVRTD